MTTTPHAVDAFLDTTLALSDDALLRGVERADAAGLPAIQITAPQGKLLQLFARLVDARKILEVGTLAGYSTTWLARALRPGGRLVTLEIDPKHAEVARANVVDAGLADFVDIRVGRAIDSLADLESEQAGPFDLVFIDADKPGNPDYIRAALRLSRPGTLIVVDNVIRDGSILDPEADASARGSRAALELFGSEPRIDATAIQTVGSKGYDGFAVGLVLP